MRLLEKLLGDGKLKNLSLTTKAWMEPGFVPHLIYANLDFDSDLQSSHARKLIEWYELVGPGWTERRTIEYLRAHQSEFRDCLFWLTREAPVDLEHLQEDFDSDLLDEADLRLEWKRDPQVRFLQLHAITHGSICLEPRVGPAQAKDPVAHFWGTTIGQGKIKDPLDPICWHLLHLLMIDGVITVRQCRYKGCEKFFQLQTARREFCSDWCRSRHNMKSTEKNRKYMRKYRRRLKEMKEGREKGKGTSKSMNIHSAASPGKVPPPIVDSQSAPK